MVLGKGLVDLVAEMGRHLGYEVAIEVEASESAWVDVVWFDKRFSFESIGIKKGKMRFSPVVPVAAFEIEIKTGTNAKHIKGSVSNLDNLGAQLGIVGIGAGNIEALKKVNANAGKTDTELKKILMDRVYRWVYAESQPRNRIVIMFENEIINWAKHIGINPELYMA